MKYIRKRPSGVDKDIPVFEVAFGIQELKLMTAICETARRNMPTGFEFTIPKSRLNNILNEFNKILNNYLKQ